MEGDDDDTELQAAVTALKELKLGPGRFDDHILTLIARTVLLAAWTWRHRNAACEVIPMDEAETQREIRLLDAALSDILDALKSKNFARAELIAKLALQRKLSLNPFVTGHAR